MLYVVQIKSPDRADDIKVFRKSDDAKARYLEARSCQATPDKLFKLDDGEEVYVVACEIFKVASARLFPTGGTPLAGSGS